jgi:hypothetical protein
MQRKKEGTRGKGEEEEERRKKRGREANSMHFCPCPVTYLAKSPPLLMVPTEAPTFPTGQNPR